VNPIDVEEGIRSGLAGHPDAVIVGGGDGTVRTAAGALAGSDTPLGVLPMGTWNHFAKDLQIPVDGAKAVAALAGGVARDVDLGEVNGHVFINNCSIGAYAAAVRRRDALRGRGLGKWGAMARASLDELRQLRRLRLKIATRAARVVPGEADWSQGKTALVPSRLVRTPMVVVGNNRYSGHLLNQHLRPRLDAGELWLYTVRAHRQFAVLRMMLQSCLRRLDDVAALEAEPAREIVIESDSGRLPVAADGEIIEVSPPLHFRIWPAALRVLVPARAHAGKGEAAAARHAMTR
jgi:diacylglycerol kinase family enzyme